jgi:hypothetical protein
MPFHRGSDGSEPLRAQPIAGLPGAHEERAARPWRLSGTLACRRCDAPISLGGHARALSHALHCPYCGHTAALHDFLSLAAPTRPTRVQIRMLPRPRRARGRPQPPSRPLSR